MADLDDFKKAVIDACQYFISQDWRNLKDKLDDHVVMKRIDDPEKFHSGKRDVMNYFHTHGQEDKAKFEYDPNNICWKIINDRIGVVSGGGRFWDTANTTQPRPIAFSFSFLKVNHRWLAINLWGAYAD